MFWGEAYWIADLRLSGKPAYDAFHMLKYFQVREYLVSFTLYLITAAAFFLSFLSHHAFFCGCG